MEDKDIQLLSNQCDLEVGYRELVENNYNRFFDIERNLDEFLNDIGKGEEQ